MEKVLTVVAAILASIGIALLMAFPVMWLWNDLMPELFGLSEINFKHALELSLLTSIIFKSDNK